MTIFRKLNWKAYSGKQQHLILEEVKKAITSCGGFIIDFNFFSDLAINLSIEIEGSKISNLHKELSHVLSMGAQEATDQGENPEEGWMIFLHISFSRGTGNVHQDIPSVPG